MTPPKRLLVVRIASLVPGILHCLLQETHHCLKDPTRHVFAFRSADWLVWILIHQEFHVDLPHLCLVWLIDSHVNWLHKSGATARDEFNLDAKHMNCIGNAHGQMNLEGIEVEDGDDANRSHHGIRCKDLPHPLEHHILVELHLVLGGVCCAGGMIRQLAPVDCPIFCILVYDEWAEHFPRCHDCQSDSALLAIVGALAHVDGALSANIDGSLGGQTIELVCLVHVVGTVLAVRVTHTLWVGTPNCM